MKGNQLFDPRTGLANVVVDDIPIQVNSSQSTYSNFGTGLLINTSKIYVGLAYDHIFNPTYSFDGISKEIQVLGTFTAQVGGSIIPLKKHDFFLLSPSVNLISTGGYDDLWFSNVIQLGSLFFGGSYSVNNDALFSIGYNNDNVRVNYTYGMTKPRIGTNSRLSSHQIGLTFNFKPKK